MTTLARPSEKQVTTSPLRFVTAAGLFDGHDASINIMRRLIQDRGAEVIHLGHNRSVEDVVRAALQEDADAIALSSYQGGHLEYFRYMVDMLAERGAAHVRVFGGGGGTITHEEIADLEAYGVEKIYHPDDGMRLGLTGMVDDVVARTARHRAARGEVPPPDGAAVAAGEDAAVGRVLSAIEDGAWDGAELERLREAWAGRAASSGVVPVVGVTGTGGAGKSSVIDELLNRFLVSFPQMRVAVLSVDPTRRRTGGALLGDRIRMNTLRSPRVYMRSMATRARHVAVSAVLRDAVAFLRSAGFDLVLVETAGIGQADSAVVELVDLPVYVMTSDYGAASQLEKIDMLDYADLVVLNKYDRRGAEDALRDVRKQWRRNRVAFDVPDEEVPVYPTIASQFNDPGITWMFVNLCRLVRERVLAPGSDGRAGTDGAARPPARVDFRPELDTTLREPRATVLIPPSRVRYLAEIAEQGRAANAAVAVQADAADRAQAYWTALKDLGDPRLPGPLEAYADADLTAGQPSGRDAAAEPSGRDAAAGPIGPPTHRPDATPGGPETTPQGPDATLLQLRRRYDDALGTLSPESLALLRGWPERLRSITDEAAEYQVRGRAIRVENYRESLSHLRVPKVAAPRYRSWGDLLQFLGKENLPGHYPYTAGVYPYRRTGEDPTRMFAGEGTPERTNRRFHYLSRGQTAVRLSTAFDSVTLYGEDPAPRPDIYGKVGNSGVNVPTLDDMKKLYSGFDLCAPTTSVSMTINGPAPIILAMFLTTAIDQQVEKYLRTDPDRWAAAQRLLEQRFAGRPRPVYAGDLPPGHDGLGLALLGVTGDELVDAATYERIKDETLRVVRGTVQADILKEDQAQNTCIFSTEFALRMMGDIQEYFIRNGVRNFYSVSISGYHIAEAGANPVSQLAFTLANGLTFVEYYLARGMAVDDFAPNLSFFFSNGMDPEYTVIGRVARRIWARAMRDRYGAGPRSQMLKYHIQTSGRSLHAQEIEFNDIRTTLQALYALFDATNSLHTNAYDEAVTTPTEESVRRAMAIQMIITRELGLSANENPWQGSFVVSELTDLVEEAVYREFDAISERGGVLGAMDTMYQRGRIQEESLYYERRKHDGSLPIVGVNTFLPAEHAGEIATPVKLIRSTEEEKAQQIANVRAFQEARNPLAPVGATSSRHLPADGGRGRSETGRGGSEAGPAGTGAADGGAHGLAFLQRAARDRENVFEALMEAVRTHSLGQISHALYDVGGEYRRNM
ncbi:methylmalonyl-CoA mutase [Georgenia soli]|uniref:Fused isobutyryl-CoA mutase n=1 Tax=Georgenia soli TaxID=638953 RepID=A0A2A9ELV8_9MICO|nr:methylmalonyl-CoA mutase family protein [Georgenia soli]PFG39220.1 methylmalonyl-CoA mutase [Georgenia soli]